MAQLDASIFLQQKGPDLSQVGEGFDRGIRLGELMKERKVKDLELQKQNTIKDAYNNSYDTNPDGSRVFNPIKLVDLVGKAGYGQDAEALNQQFRTQQATNLKSDSESEQNKNSFLSSLIGTVKDQATYDAAKAVALAKGFKEASTLPNTYDPSIVNSLKAQYGMASMPYEKQLEDSRKREEDKNKNSIEWAKINAEKEKTNAKTAPKTTEQKLAGLGAGEKQRLDYAKQGLDAIKRMDDALVNGDNTFSVIGDNDFTKAKREASEAYGRMQSGGAISLPEEERFDKTSPGKTDDQKIQRTKLADQQKLFVDRIKTLGFTPEELGINPQEIQYGVKSAAPKEGETKEYQGVTYRVVNGHWVQQ